VPATWPRNDLRCGQPAGTTLIVQPAGAVVPLCYSPMAMNFHPDVVWLGGFIPPLDPAAAFGPVDPPRGGVAAMTPVTIGGEPAREWHTRDRRTRDPAVLVVLPRREVFVVVSSRHQRIRDAAVASIRIVRNDPATGCATRTTGYDAPPRRPRFDRTIDVSNAVGLTACHYVTGWLETTAASMPPRSLRALVDAIDQAPHVTSARAPVDRGCESVDRGPPEYDSDGPVVLRFQLRDGTATVVVVRIVWCTRWQSYLYAGDVMRRLTGAVLLALPPGLLVSYPGPDTM
jgi:hypothetical protein